MSKEKTNLNEQDDFEQQVNEQIDNLFEMCVVNMAYTEAIQRLLVKLNIVNQGELVELSNELYEKMKQTLLEEE